MEQRTVGVMAGKPNEPIARVSRTVLPANSTQRATAQEQLDTDHNTLTSLNNQAAALLADLANPSGGSIISNATPPLTATSPKSTLMPVLMSLPLKGQLTPDEVSQHPAGIPLLRVITLGTGASTADDLR